LFGKNAAEDNTVSPLLGSWISVIIIIPFAIYLANRATNDRGLLNYNLIFNPLSDIFERIKEKIK
jgi:lipopolysaccharide export system permease protein